MANEVRLIDANALHKMLEEAQDGTRRIYFSLVDYRDKEVCKGELGTYARVKRMVEEAPTIAGHLLDNGVTFAADKNDGGKWISVNERLPECKQDVLMYFDTGNMAVGWWYDRDEVITFWSAYSDDGWYTDCDCEPLYWMPLPEPPKEE